MPEPKSTKTKSIEELLKDGTIKSGSDPSLIVEWLSTGLPKLDNLMGGGFPLGRCVESFGPESTGKTLIAQYLAKSVQASERPGILYIDLENSFDEEWWILSGVDTKKIWVTKPATGELAIDIMRQILQEAEGLKLGLIILDSIAGMVPSPEMDPKKSAQDNHQPGMQAKLVTLMYRSIVSLVNDNKVIFYAINQMRDNMGPYPDDIGALVGGHAQRHYSLIMLKTRRESWIKEGDNRIGFYMEITSRKNKLATTPDGTTITLPFLFSSQIDMLTADLEEAVEKKIIDRKGPYYKFNMQNLLGMPNLRNYFLSNPEAMTLLRDCLEASNGVSA